MGRAERRGAPAEIAPDPPGWRTALRFDVDCVCDGRLHVKRGYCPRAADYWRDVALAEPSFIVVNPTNGHAHYVYLLRGWVRVDGASVADVAAVRYFIAIERAYTRALRADAGYAGLVQHNPFHARYETFSGRDEPYSLRELAAYVELPRMVPRRTEIRTDSRNVETFDRLRFWAYATIGEFRCGPRETWNDVVDARALAIAAEVRAAHPQATHPYSDSEALDTAKSVAGWVWSRYVGGHLTRVRVDTSARREDDRQRATAARRARGAITRDDYLAEAQRRRTAACTLRCLGVAVAEIARRLTCTIRSVQRYLSELDPLVRYATSPSVPSDFEAPRRPIPKAALESATTEKQSDRHFTVVVNHPQKPREGPRRHSRWGGRGHARTARNRPPTCQRPEGESEGEPRSPQARVHPAPDRRDRRAVPR